MTAFDVELAALPAARAEADRVHGELQKALGDVTGSVTGLVGSGWKGAAANAFAHGFQEWKQGASEVLQALATMSELITATEQAYSTSDTLSADQMNRLGGSALMPAFTVDLDRLDSVIALLSSRSQTISTELDALDAQIAKLHDVWSGSAAAAQLAAHREWTAGAQGMRAALDDMRRAAQTAHANYSAAVAANQKMWS